MSRLFIAAIAGLLIYYEWPVVKIALSPLIDIVVVLCFIVLMLILLVCEIALIVIGPMAVIFGYDSRLWHVVIARKVMMSKTWSDTK